MSAIPMPDEAERQTIQLKFLQSFADRCVQLGMLDRKGRLLTRCRSKAFEFFVGALALEEAIYGKGYLVPAGFVFGLQYESCIYTYVLGRIAAFDRPTRADAA